MKEYTSDIELPRGMLKWIIAFLVAVFVGAGALTIYTIVKEKGIRREILQNTTAASWAGDPVTNWPRLVLLQRAEFKHHSPMAQSCSSLIQLPKGEVVALTAGHLLGEAGGVTPGFLNGLGGLDPLKLLKLDQEIVSWELYARPGNPEKVQVAGLFGEPASYEDAEDQLLLRLVPRTNGWPATPMTLRFTPVEPGEPLYLVGYTRDGDSVEQSVHRASRLADTAGLVCELTEPANLTAHTGAPIVDQRGLVVGVMAGTVLLDKADERGRIHKFRGRSVATLLPGTRRHDPSSTMIELEQLKTQIEAAVSGARVIIIPNDSPSGQRSLLVDNEHGVAVARFLRDDAALRFDYASNVTGVDWLDTELVEKFKVKKVVEGVEKEVEEVKKTPRPGYLEAVYHLYSTEKKHGPVIIRLRTGNRTDQNHLPSLTAVWRGAEFQEREIYDLYGIIFDGHPDLRRILMWDGFKDFPMRKDYVEPDDYEYEPTPHDEVLEKAKQHYPEPKSV